MSTLGPGSVLGGKYRLVKRLAGGGMGSVWLAHHEVLGAEVAVKLMSSVLADTPSALARFEREAKASAQLKSLHICKVQDYGVDDGTPFMVMERLEGEDLAQRLARVGRLPAAELSGILQQIARALSVAHQAGIVHRDLKPSNVYIVHEGSSEIVKLLDFGIARELGGQLVDDQTASGMVIGSPHHMSPEQAHGEKVDLRSDLWSLGVLMYTALTGKRPFEGEQMTAVMLKIVSTTPTKPSLCCDDLPAGIDAFFDKALARDPSARFQSAVELADTFQALVAGKQPSTWLTPSEPRASLPSRADSVPSSSGQHDAARGASAADATGSRELRAVTAGTGDSLVQSSRSSARRALPWGIAIGVFAALGAALLFFSASPRADGVNAAGAASNAGPSVAATAELVASSSAAASGPSAEPVIAPIPSASVSSAASAPSVAPKLGGSAPKPVSAPPRPAGPRPGAQVDPFTGLPVP